MAVFNRGGPAPSGGDEQPQAASDHQAELREVTRREHEARKVGKPTRRRWWSFGIRSDR